MRLKLMKRDAFSLGGYCVKTSLETCAVDLGKLWKECDMNSRKRYDEAGKKKVLYGLMWKTEASGSAYFYLLGTETDAEAEMPEDMEQKFIPAAEYAVLSVPISVSAVDAWTEFYGKILPEAGYTPAEGHTFDFECYPQGLEGNYELWTPVETG